MEANSASPATPDPITQALACYDAAYRNRKAAADRDRHPKFKPLVLSVFPSARVRRVGGVYECYIGADHVRCGGEHATPDRAWLCLARFIAARGAKQ